MDIFILVLTFKRVSPWKAESRWNQAIEIWFKKIKCDSFYLRWLLYLKIPVSSEHCPSPWSPSHAPSDTHIRMHMNTYEHVYTHAYAHTWGMHTHTMHAHTFTHTVHVHTHVHNTQRTCAYTYPHSATKGEGMLMWTPCCPSCGGSRGRQLFTLGLCGVGSCHFMQYVVSFHTVFQLLCLRITSVYQTEGPGFTYLFLCYSTFLLLLSFL